MTCTPGDDKVLAVLFYLYSVAILQAATQAAFFCELAVNLFRTYTLRLYLPTYYNMSATEAWEVDVRDARMVSAVWRAAPLLPRQASRPARA